MRRRPTPWFHASFSERTTTAKPANTVSEIYAVVMKTLEAISSTIGRTGGVVNQPMTR